MADAAAAAVGELVQVSHTSAETQALCQHLASSFLDKEYSSELTITAIHKINNRELERQYEEKRAEMHARGRTDEEVKEIFGFTVAKKSMTYLKKIVNEGLTTQRTDYNAFGDSAKGVYISQHCDVMLKFAENHKTKFLRIIVHKLIPGKLLATKQGPAVQPTSGYDGHVSPKKPEVNDSLELQVMLSQLYIYELDDLDNPLPHPRQSLPYAVFTFERTKKPDADQQQPSQGSSTTSTTTVATSQHQQFSLATAPVVQQQPSTRLITLTPRIQQTTQVQPTQGNASGGVIAATSLHNAGHSTTFAPRTPNSPFSQAPYCGMSSLAAYTVPASSGSTVPQQNPQFVRILRADSRTIRQLMAQQAHLPAGQRKVIVPVVSGQPSQLQLPASKATSKSTPTRGRGSGRGRGQTRGRGASSLLLGRSSVAGSSTQQTASTAVGYQYTIPPSGGVVLPQGVTLSAVSNLSDVLQAGSTVQSTLSTPAGVPSANHVIQPQNPVDNLHVSYAHGSVSSMQNMSVRQGTYNPNLAVTTLSSATPTNDCLMSTDPDLGSVTPIEIAPIEGYGETPTTAPIEPQPAPFEGYADTPSVIEVKREKSRSNNRQRTTSIIDLVSDEETVPEVVDEQRDSSRTPTPTVETVPIAEPPVPIGEPQDSGSESQQGQPQELREQQELPQQNGIQGAETEGTNQSEPSLIEPVTITPSTTDMSGRNSSEAGVGNNDCSQDSRTRAEEDPGQKMVQHEFVKTNEDGTIEVVKEYVLESELRKRQAESTRLTNTHSWDLDSMDEDDEGGDMSLELTSPGTSSRNQVEDDLTEPSNSEPKRTDVQSMEEPAEKSSKTNGSVQPETLVTPSASSPRASSPIADLTEKTPSVSRPSDILSGVESDSGRESPHLGLVISSVTSAADATDSVAAADVKQEDGQTETESRSSPTSSVEVSGSFIPSAVITDVGPEFDISCLPEATPNVADDDSEITLTDTTPLLDESSNLSNASSSTTKLQEEGQQPSKTINSSAPNKKRKNSGSFPKKKQKVPRQPKPDKMVHGKIQKINLEDILSRVYSTVDSPSPSTSNMSSSGRVVPPEPEFHPSEPTEEDFHNFDDDMNSDTMSLCELRPPVLNRTFGPRECKEAETDPVFQPVVLLTDCKGEVEPTPSSPVHYSDTDYEIPIPKKKLKKKQKSLPQWNTKAILQWSPNKRKLLTARKSVTKGSLKPAKPVTLSHPRFATNEMSRSLSFTTTTLLGSMGSLCGAGTEQVSTGSSEKISEPDLEKSKSDLLTPVIPLMDVLKETGHPSEPPANNEKLSDKSAETCETPPGPQEQDLTTPTSDERIATEQVQSEPSSEGGINRSVGKVTKGRQAKRRPCKFAKRKGRPRAKPTPKQDNYDNSSSGNESITKRRRSATEKVIPVRRGRSLKALLQPDNAEEPNEPKPMYMAQLKNTESEFKMIAAQAAQEAIAEKSGIDVPLGTPIATRASEKVTPPARGKAKAKKGKSQVEPFFDPKIPLIRDDPTYVERTMYKPEIPGILDTPNTGKNKSKSKALPRKAPQPETEESTETKDAETKDSKPAADPVTLASDNDDLFLAMLKDRLKKAKRVEEAEKLKNLIDEFCPSASKPEEDSSQSVSAAEQSTSVQKQPDVKINLDDYDYGDEESANTVLPDLPKQEIEPAPPVEPEDDDLMLDTLGLGHTDNHPDEALVGLQDERWKILHELEECEEPVDAEPEDKKTARKSPGRKKKQHKKRRKRRSDDKAHKETSDVPNEQCPSTSENQESMETHERKGKSGRKRLLSTDSWSNSEGGELISGGSENSREKKNSGEDGKRQSTGSEVGSGGKVKVSPKKKLYTDSEVIRNMMSPKAAQKKEVRERNLFDGYGSEITNSWNVSSDPEQWMQKLQQINQTTLNPDETNVLEQILASAEPQAASADDNTDTVIDQDKKEAEEPGKEQERSVEQVTNSIKESKPVEKEKPAKVKLKLDAYLARTMEKKALQVAVEKSIKDVTASLLTETANERQLNVARATEGSALHVPVEKPIKDVTASLLTETANERQLNFARTTEQSALHVPVEKPIKDVTASLLNETANERQLNFAKTTERSALHVPVEKPIKDVTASLLTETANERQLNFAGTTERSKPDVSQGKLMKDVTALLLTDTSNELQLNQRIDSNIKNEPVKVLQFEDIKRILDTVKMNEAAAKGEKPPEEKKPKPPLKIPNDPRITLGTHGEKPKTQRQSSIPQLPDDEISPAQRISYLQNNMEQIQIKRKELVQELNCLKKKVDTPEGRNPRLHQEIQILDHFIRGLYIDEEIIKKEMDNIRGNVKGQINQAVPIELLLPEEKATRHTADGVPLFLMNKLLNDQYGILLSLKFDFVATSTEWKKTEVLDSDKKRTLQKNFSFIKDHRRRQIAMLCKPKEYRVKLKEYSERMAWYQRHHEEFLRDYSRTPNPCTEARIRHMDIRIAELNTHVKHLRRVMGLPLESSSKAVQPVGARSEPVKPEAAESKPGTSPRVDQKPKEESHTAASSPKGETRNPSEGTLASHSTEPKSQNAPSSAFARGDAISNKETPLTFPSGEMPPWLRKKDGTDRREEVKVDKEEDIPPWLRKRKKVEQPVEATTDGKQDVNLSTPTVRHPEEISQKMPDTRSSIESSILREIQGEAAKLRIGEEQGSKDGAASRSQSDMDLCSDLDLDISLDIPLADDIVHDLPVVREANESDRGDKLDVLPDEHSAAAPSAVSSIPVLVTSPVTADVVLKPQPTSEVNSIPVIMNVNRSQREMAAKEDLMVPDSGSTVQQEKVKDDISSENTSQSETSKSHESDKGTSSSSKEIDRRRPSSAESKARTSDKGHSESRSSTSRDREHSENQSRTSRDREYSEYRSRTSRDREYSENRSRTSKDRDHRESRSNTSKDREHSESRPSTSRDREHSEGQSSTSKDREQSDSRSSTAGDRKHPDSRSSTSRDREHSESRSITSKEHSESQSSSSRDREHSESRSSTYRVKEHSESRSSSSRDREHFESRSSTSRVKEHSERRSSTLSRPSSSSRSSSSRSENREQRSKTKHSSSTENRSTHSSGSKSQTETKHSESHKRPLSEHKDRSSTEVKRHHSGKSHTRRSPSEKDISDSRSHDHDGSKITRSGSIDSNDSRGSLKTVISKASSECVVSKTHNQTQRESSGVSHKTLGDSDSGKSTPILIDLTTTDSPIKAVNHPEITEESSRSSSISSYQCPSTKDDCPIESEEEDLLDTSGTLHIVIPDDSPVPKVVSQEQEKSGLLENVVDMNIDASGDKIPSPSSIGLTKQVESEAQIGGGGDNEVSSALGKEVAAKEFPKHQQEEMGTLVYDEISSPSMPGSPFEDDIVITRTMQLTREQLLKQVLRRKSTLSQMLAQNEQFVKKENTNVSSMSKDTVTMHDDDDGVSLVIDEHRVEAPREGSESVPSESTQNTVDTSSMMPCVSECVDQAHASSTSAAPVGNDLESTIERKNSMDEGTKSTDQGGGSTPVLDEECETTLTSKESEPILIRQEERESTPVLVEDCETITILNEEHETILISDQGHESTPVMDERREIIPISDEISETTLIREEARESTPVMDEGCEVTPLSDGNSETTLIRDQGHESTPVMDEGCEVTPLSDGNSETTLIRDVRGESTPVMDEGCEVTPLSDGNTETTLIWDEVHESTLVIDESLEVPPFSVEISEMTLIRDVRRESTPVMDERHEITPLHLGNSENTLIREVGRESTPVIDERREITPTPEEVPQTTKEAEMSNCTQGKDVVSKVPRGLTKKSSHKVRKHSKSGQRAKMSGNETHITKPSEIEDLSMVTQSTDEASENLTVKSPSKKAHRSPKKGSRHRIIGSHTATKDRNTSQRHKLSKTGIKRASGKEASPEEILYSDNALLVSSQTIPRKAAKTSPESKPVPQKEAKIKKAAAQADALIAFVKQDIAAKEQPVKPQLSEEYSEDSLISRGNIQKLSREESGPTVQVKGGNDPVYSEKRRSRYHDMDSASRRQAFKHKGKTDSATTSQKGSTDKTSDPWEKFPQRYKQPAWSPEKSLETDESCNRSGSTSVDRSLSPPPRVSREGSYHSQEGSYNSRSRSPYNRPSKSPPRTNMSLKRKREHNFAAGNEWERDPSPQPYRDSKGHKRRSPGTHERSTRRRERHLHSPDRSSPRAESPSIRDAEEVRGWETRAEKHWTREGCERIPRRRVSPGDAPWMRESHTGGSWRRGPHYRRSPESSPSPERISWSSTLHAAVESSTDRRDVRTRSPERREVRDRSPRRRDSRERSPPRRREMRNISPSREMHAGSYTSQYSQHSRSVSHGSASPPGIRSPSPSPDSRRRSPSPGSWDYHQSYGHGARQQFNEEQENQYSHYDFRGRGRGWGRGRGRGGYDTNRGRMQFRDLRERIGESHQGHYNDNVEPARPVPPYPIIDDHQPWSQPPPVYTTSHWQS